MAELRLPKGKGPFPVAIIIHGGCWRSGPVDLAGMTPLARALNRRGIATWTIEYRGLGDAGGGWPATFVDVAAAEDKLASVASRYPLDLRRVAIVGHSAGAHLALWAASRAKLRAPWGAPRIRPVSVVAIDGPPALAAFIDLERNACGGPVIETLMGGTPTEKPDPYRLASPADHLPLGLRQLLVGGIFRPLLRPYADDAAARGDPVILLEPPGATHLDIVDPATPNGAAVVDFIVKNAF